MLTIMFIRRPHVKQCEVCVLSYDLLLYFVQAYLVIESFRRASEQMVSGGGSQKMGGRSATDADTLLRVLCHRTDKDTSKFLKKQYKMPS